MISLCEVCAERRVITSGTGSRFLLCQKSLADKHYPKYPPQPVVQCTGFQNAPKDCDVERT